MSSAPEGMVPYPDVTGKTVLDTKVCLESFTDLNWKNEEGNTIDDPQDPWTVKTQEPASYDGDQQSTTIVITLTITPPKMG